MFLYHGTSESALRGPKGILSGGISPRNKIAARRGNWRNTVPSNPSVVYLTDTYPAYFAWVAAENAKDARMAIVEVDTDFLGEKRFVPDEDALEQSLRSRDDVPGDLKARTLHYRKYAFIWQPQWKSSLAALGTVGYRGTVPCAAIRRVCLVDMKQRRDVVMGCADPCITLLNHRICGNKYKNLTRWLFGEEISLEDYIGFGPEIAKTLPPGYQQQAEAVLGNRAGIEIIALSGVNDKPVSPAEVAVPI